MGRDYDKELADIANRLNEADTPKFAEGAAKSWVLTPTRSYQRLDQMSNAAGIPEFQCVQRSPSSIDGDFYRRAASWCCSAHRSGNRGKPSPDQPPPALAEDHDRNLAIGQILLITDVPIGRDEYIESGCLGRVK